MDDSGVDRISGLEDHLLRSILDLLPVDDVVRTSFLSNSWRYRWRKMSKLVFDRRFYEKMGQPQDCSVVRLINIVNQLLLLNVGSISKFHIYIPNIEAQDIFEEIDQWILYLSGKPVKELIIENTSQHYQPLSCLYTTFDKLILLKLDRCIFKPPLEDIKFFRLQKLILFDVNFTETDYRKEMNLPALNMLVLRDCTNVHNLNIKASKLNSLYVKRCHDANYPKLLDGDCITFVWITLLNPIERFVQAQRNDLGLLFKKTPKMDNLTIDGPFFKSSIGDKPMVFPLRLNNLKTLRLERFSCSDLHQLKCAFCMFCNSPNLEALLMTNIQMDLDYLSPAVHYLKREAHFNLTRLQTFEISTLQGSPQQMAFLEILLGRSPSLKKCIISTVSGWKHIIHHDVLKFNWASKTSELIIKE